MSKSNWEVIKKYPLYVKNTLTGEIKKRACKVVKVIETYDNSGNLIDEVLITTYQKERTIRIRNEKIRNKIVKICTILFRGVSQGRRYKNLINA
jgi:hypothetical protein